MSAVDEEIENKPVRPCSGLRAELLKCLKETECFNKYGLTPKQCLDSSSPGYDPSCQPIVVALFECKRSLFSEQDVMVPWHLQPHYSPGHDPTHSAKKKKEKKRRRKSKQSKTKREEGKDMQDIDDEKTDSSSHNKVVDSSDLLRTPSPTSLLMTTASSIVEPVPSSKDNDVSVSSPHVPGDDKHAFDLQQHGFRTFYRYYHVFVDKELIELCKRVPSLKILDYWYDHDNWCLLAQKLN